MAQVAESWASSPAARKVMQGNRRRDTVPELAVRRALHTRGLRYRVDYPLPFDRRRKADIVFTKRKIAVFIDGCYWHACPLHYSEPLTNASYWSAKIAGNVSRDRDTDTRLAALGWTVLRYWEHEDHEAIVRQVTEVVMAPGRLTGLSADRRGGTR
jgi:DNA mismatch endonuclease, patch repair protein